MQAFSSTLQSSINQYNQILSDGYDDKFTYYSDYVKELIPGKLADFFNNGSTKYCHCIVGDAYGHNSSLQVVIPIKFKATSNISSTSSQTIAMHITRKFLAHMV